MSTKNGTKPEMVADVRRPRGRPKKEITAEKNVTFRLEQHVKNVVNSLPKKERRGYFRKLVHRDLLRRGLIERDHLASC